jgi:hypothetical protein
MWKRFSDIYVVAKSNNLLYSDCLYDFNTAESVCNTAKGRGYINAEVIALSYAIRYGYKFE